MQGQKLQNLKQRKRHQRVRLKLSGTPERPRISLCRSHRNISVQIIDDTHQKTLFSFSTQNKEIKSKVPYGGNLKAASLLGEIVASKTKEKGITKVAFDKGHCAFHGRIKAFVEGARKGGLEF